MSGRPGKNDVQRSEVLMNAAIEVFIRKGVAAASVDEIAKASQVSKATLYRHFEDKHDLFEKALEHFIMKRRIDLPKLDPREDTKQQLRSFAQALLGTLCNKETVQVFRAVIGEAGRNRKVGKFFFERITKEGVYALAEFFKTIPQLKGRDTELLAFQFLGNLKERCFWPAIFTNSFPAKREIERVIDNAIELHFSLLKKH